jgi:hypothetical protein
MLEREIVAFEDPYYPEQLDQLQVHIDLSLAAGLVPALKRPEILHRNEASSRARRHLPNPLVIVVLREPIARTVSAYHHYVAYGLLPAIDPNVALPAILDELRETSAASIKAEVVNYSLYAAALARLRQDFGERLLILFQEDLLSNTEPCLAQILGMLGIPSCDLGPLPHSNVGDYSLNRRKLSRLAGRIGYDIDDCHATFRVTQHALRRRTAQALFALDRLRPSMQRPQPVLTPSVRRRLVETLADDASLLPEIVRQPLPNAWVSSLQL